MLHLPNIDFPISTFRSSHMFQPHFRQRNKQLQQLDFVGAVKAATYNIPTLNAIDASGYLEIVQRGTLD
jgi:hypothetical protein